jgi:hypothetical protein
LDRSAAACRRSGHLRSRRRDGGAGENCPTPPPTPSLRSHEPIPEESLTVTDDMGDIRSIRIEDEMRVSYLDYAMSVIVSRAPCPTSATA